MANDFSSIPVGDIQFMDNLIPVLGAGNYTIQVSQTLAGIATGPIGTTQKFVVAAPQVSIDPVDVNTTYPPQNLTGLYGDVLPHVVLNMAVLPWERPLDSNDRSIPWMALLIFSPDELLSRSTLPTKAINGTVASFSAPPVANVFRPTITPDKDVTGASPLQSIQIPIALFRQIAPRKDELKYLAHVRALNLGDKAVDGLTGTGTYSVVIANRFPQASATDPLGQQNIAHLVSLEGMGNYLGETADFGAGKDTLELISLYSWTFRTLPDPSADFQGLLQAIVRAEGPANAQDPSKLWLALDGSGLPAGEAKNRVQAGYVPLSYLTRSGEQTFAWYRGPFAPLLPTTYTTAGKLDTADAGIIYDAANGIFDHSLAAAWQAGRTVALADKSFGTNLLRFRRKASQVVDRLHYVNAIQGLTTPESIAAAIQGNYFQQQFDLALQNEILSQVGQPSNDTHGGGGGPGTAPILGGNTPPGTNLVQSLRDFMNNPSIQTAVQTETDDELKLVVDKLTRLSLLYDVPFNNLVADARLLPEESLRFFYVDENWMNALRDGALSIAQHSSRDALYASLVRRLIEAGVTKAMAAYRATLLGDETAPGTDGITHVSGFLLRSAIVSGWPGLSVQGLDANGQPLKVLRLDHVSNDVLLVLFWGSPNKLLLTEPQEGFRFGVNQDGQIELRSLAAGPGLGDPLRMFQIRTAGADGFFTRAGTQGRVLRIDPTNTNGLIQAISGQLQLPVTSFGPADFAIQMVNAPEQQTFDPPR